MNIIKNAWIPDDINIYYVAALYMRSFARLYHEAEAVVDAYAGIVRESEQQKEVVRNNVVMASKINKGSFYEALYDKALECVTE